MHAAVAPPPGDWLYFVTVRPGDTRFTGSYEASRSSTPYAPSPAPRAADGPRDAPERAVARQTSAGSCSSSRRISRTAARPARLAPIVEAEGP